ncbi:MAG: RagB/SusD family nutrient uptake outer membrane protein, partial [Prevotellaceae bacterium]|nr:RagB/SusD family nutrient uptake outer membrane protein [Prevotellaceae bacterium]
DVTSLTSSTLFSGTTSATLGNIPEPSVITSSEKYEIAVLNERQVEFLAEGKRWFDLVRYAERHAGGQDGTQDPREWTEELPIGNGTAGVEAMVEQFLKNEFSSNYTSLKNRFKNRYGLYNIIYYKEISASEGMLEQNPVWNKSTYEQ